VELPARDAAPGDGSVRGRFSLRTPVRPNPIATSIVELDHVDGDTVFVRGLDCIDGTPLLDLKPDRTLFMPLAAPQPGDPQVGDSDKPCPKA
jgi:tRNA (adenine37-N6)-methyltransferase